MDISVLGYAEILKFDNQISRSNYRILSLEDESRMRMLAIAFNLNRSRNENINYIILTADCA